MAAPSNHWKLGLFVVLGIAAAVAAIAAFGARSMKHETIAYYTYYNESVTGLEVGSPVRFRGVTIGHVSAIEIAVDHRHVEVKNDLDVADLKRLGLIEQSVAVKGTPLPLAKKTAPRFLVPPDLRAQLGSQGITGVKFVAIDFFDVKSNPTPPLPFAPPENYIPAAASLMKNLEDSVTKAMDRLPELADAIVGIMGRVDRLLATLEKEDVSGKAAIALVHTDQMLSSVQKTLAKIDRSNVPEKAAATIENLNVAVNKMNAVLDKIDGPKGFVASATRAADNVGEMGKSASGSTRALDETLRDIREAVEAIRLLAESLEKDPDMLLKGRAKAKSQ